MHRSGFLCRTTRLRPVSAKRRVSRLGRRDDPVYQAVDQRAGGRCEVVLDGFRCARAAGEHHHARKPRATWHAPEFVVAMCPIHHLQCDAPMVRGKLVVSPLGGGLFLFRIIVGRSKFHPGPEAA